MRDMVCYTELREHTLKEVIGQCRMDLLVIKKLTNVKIKNEIGRIFKRHNVVEYKSPEDELGIDDYYKTVGYACLYKGFGETADQIPAGEITVSLFRESYPRELYEAIGRDSSMFEVLKVLLKDELEREKQEAVQETVQELEKEKQEAVQEAVQEKVQELKKEKQEAEKKMIQKMLKSRKNSIEEIADYCTEFTQEEIREIEAEMMETV